MRSGLAGDGVVGWGGNRFAIPTLLGGFWIGGGKASLWFMGLEVYGFLFVICFCLLFVFVCLFVLFFCFLFLFIYLFIYFCLFSILDRRRGICRCGLRSGSWLGRRRGSYF